MLFAEGCSCNFGIVIGVLYEFVRWEQQIVSMETPDLAAAVRLPGIVPLLVGDDAGDGLCFILTFDTVIAVVDDLWFGMRQ